MKAAVYRKLGPASEVLLIEDISSSALADTDVRVEIHASGVNPSDVKNRSGVAASKMAFEFIVPHSDGAGVVVEAGPSVDPSWIGQRVWIWNAQFRRQFGTAAEYVVVPIDQVAALPERVTFNEGAGLGIPVMTAYRSITCGTSVENQTVMIAGGGGTVGRYAVQIAKAKGARRIIATVGHESRFASVKAAGADEVLLYEDSELTERVLDANNGGRIDRIVEVEWGKNFETDLRLIKPEGEIYVYGSAANMQPAITIQNLMLAGVTAHFRSVFLLPAEVRLAAVKDITDWLERGGLQHEMGPTFELADIALAHVAVERRDIPGHIIVEVK